MIKAPRWRVVPPEIEALLPPHPIEFHPSDPNLGRACGVCGFAIPRGLRYVHAEWCDAQQVKKRAAEEAKRPEGWDVVYSSGHIQLRRGKYSMTLQKYGTSVSLYESISDCHAVGLAVDSDALRNGTYEEQIADALAWFNGLGYSENKPSNG